MLTFLLMCSACVMFANFIVFFTAFYHAARFNAALGILRYKKKIDIDSIKRNTDAFEIGAYSNALYEAVKNIEPSDEKTEKIKHECLYYHESYKKYMTYFFCGLLVCFGLLICMMLTAFIQGKH